MRYAKDYANNQAKLKRQCEEVKETKKLKKTQSSVDNTPTLTFDRLCSHIFEEWIIN